MLILFLNVVNYDINHLKADHVQPLFTSDSQHPPRFGHAVDLGGGRQIENMVIIIGLSICCGSSQNCFNRILALIRNKKKETFNHIVFI